MKAIVMDLDGVLFDTTERWRRCEEESGGNRRMFWNCYQSPKYMHLDVPIVEMVEYARRAKERGYTVIIVSGRSEAQRQATLEQLERAGVPFDVLILRAANDFRKDYEYKAEALRQLLAAGYEVVELVDDSKAVVEATIRMGINARCYNCR